MVYQAVPSGSFTGSFGMYTTGGNSGKTIWADSTQGPGHLRVTVGPPRRLLNSSGITHHQQTRTRS